MAVDIDSLKKYSKKASWAIWNRNDSTTSAEYVVKSHLYENCDWNKDGKAEKRIREYQSSLRTDVVILGINASAICPNWSNYHFGGRSADKNLMFAFDQSPYRGCYMTDFSDKIDKKAAAVYNELYKDKVKQQAVNESLMKEFDDVGVSENALILLLGVHAAGLFHLMSLQNKYKNSIELMHCSAHGITARDWVKNTWNEITKYTTGKKHVPQFDINSKMEKIISHL